MIIFIFFHFIRTAYINHNVSYALKYGEDDMRVCITLVFNDTYIHSTNLMGNNSVSRYEKYVYINIFL